jgi:hypothetical protein
VKDSDASSRKRKRDEPQTADPKLREFLQVMKTGGEGALEDAANAHQADGASAIPAAAVPEEDSDDEYEQIPARREKQRRIEAPEKAPTSESLAPRPKETPGPADVQMQAPADEETAESSETKQPDLEHSAVVAEDDDWLRSRTNRLLDLVDPDDLERTPAQGPVVKETGHTEGGGVVNSPQANPSDEDEMTAEEPTVEASGGEPPKDDSLEAIRRTSRLFVRNLPYSATEEDLRETFEGFGALEEVCFKIVYLFFVFYNRQRDEPLIGTAYTTVFDENQGEYFSRCFDYLNCCQFCCIFLCGLSMAGHRLTMHVRSIYPPTSQVPARGLPWCCSVTRRERLKHSKPWMGRRFRGVSSTSFLPAQRETQGWTSLPSPSSLSRSRT